MNKLGLLLGGVLLVAVCIAPLSSQPATVYAQGGPYDYLCRDAQGNEICPDYNPADGRVNVMDPLATITAYCRADRSIDVWDIVNYIGKSLFIVDGQTIANALAAAQTRGAQVVVNEVSGHGLAALPGNMLQIYDRETGYMFGFSSLSCGIASAAGNASAFNGVSVAATPITAVIPPIDNNAANAAATPTNKYPAKSYTVVTRGADGKASVVLPNGFSGVLTYPATRLRFRTLPVIDKRNIIMELKTDFQLLVLGRDLSATWLYVSYAGRTGWVAGAYTKLTLNEITNLPVVIIR